MKIGLNRFITKKIPVKIIQMIGYLKSGELGNGEIFTILKKLQNTLFECTKLTLY